MEKRSKRAKYLIQNTENQAWQDAVLSTFWDISDDNVSLFCPDNDFEMIIWPESLPNGR